MLFQPSVNPSPAGWAIFNVVFRVNELTGCAYICHHPLPSLKLRPSPQHRCIQCHHAHNDLTTANACWFLSQYICYCACSRASTFPSSECCHGLARASAFANGHTCAYWMSASAITEETIMRLSTNQLHHVRVFFVRTASKQSEQNEKVGAKQRLQRKKVLSTSPLSAYLVGLNGPSSKRT